MATEQEMVAEAKRTVRTFGAASFLHDIGSDMVFSVWPIFLTHVLKANMTAVGLVDGLGDAVVSLSQAASGYYSDKWKKRKVFVWTGYLFGGASRIGYALAPTWQWIIPFRILDRSGKIRSTPRDAMVSDVSTRENRGMHFGFLRMMDNAGAVVGILLSMLLIRYIPLRTIFAIAAIPSVLAVALVLWRVRERVSEKAIFRGIRFKDFDRNLRMMFFSSALLQLGSFSYSFLLVAAANKGFEVTSTPILYLAFTLTAALVSLPAGKLADRIGRKPVLFLSLALWLLTCLLLLVQRSVPLVFLSFILYGLHLGLREVSQKTLVAELAPKDFVASTLGGFQLVIGLVSLPASMFAGLIWDRAGITWPFYVSIVLTVLSALLLSQVKEAKSA